MTKLTFGDDTTFDLEISVSESDSYSKLIRVQIDKNHGVGKIHGSSEMFLTADQLETLGRFLIRQADDVRSSQEIRSNHVV